MLTFMFRPARLISTLQRLGRALALAAALPVSAVCDAQLDSRALATIMTGAAISSADELAAALKSSKIEFNRYALYRGALAVLGEDQRFPEYPLGAIYHRLISEVMLDGPAPCSSRAPCLAADMAAEALTVALLLSDQEQLAWKELNALLGSGSAFQRAFAAHMLRLIDDGDRSRALLIPVLDDDGEDQELLNQVRSELAEKYFPTLSSFAQLHHSLIPEQRSRSAFHEMADGRCAFQGGTAQRLKSFIFGKPLCDAALGALLLGYLPGDSAADEAELNSLRLLAQSRHYITRHNALRALGLRSAESSSYWLERFRAEDSVWAQALIIRILSLHHGAALRAIALDLINQAPHQYVQWEIIYGVLRHLRAEAESARWGIWFQRSLQYEVLLHSGGRGAIPADKIRTLLLELGEKGWKGEVGVLQQLLYQITPSLDAATVLPFLRLLHAQTEKRAYWWLLLHIKQPSIRPFLQYYAENSEDPELREVSTSALSVLQAVPKAADCCDAGRECLQRRIESQLLTEMLPSTPSASELESWLAGKITAPEIRIDLSGLLEREAIVQAGERAEKWEYLYDCWHKVQQRP